ncbi:hypothetical protein GCM10014715_84420 [Streptomyces spiralis]|uniref:Uncharacterized protein n=1 Tax=Streptomyces spiralis TaxID=66376 RepID=A0A919AN05_9ACTN|nr:hypothetical protein [Streptomyces spiralis]GHF16324.1 hypothetical protein GCM10014715_84420 [Streptomyces spiralis]
MSQVVARTAAAGSGPAASGAATTPIRRPRASAFAVLVTWQVRSGSSAATGSGPPVASGPSGSSSSTQTSARAHTSARAARREAGIVRPLGLASVGWRCTSET